jgi:hypothetical protein
VAQQPTPTPARTPTCVHVLDPHRVHRPIEHQPVVVGAGVGHCRPDERRGEAVGPLVRGEVVLPVELAHVEGLGVEHVAVHHLVRLVGAAALAQLRQRCLQHLVGGGLAGACSGRSSQHGYMLGT